MLLCLNFVFHRFFSFCHSVLLLCVRKHSNDSESSSNVVWMTWIRTINTLISRYIAIVLFYCFFFLIFPPSFYWRVSESIGYNEMAIGRIYVVSKTDFLVVVILNTINHKIGYFRWICVYMCGCVGFPFKHLEKIIK